MEREPGSLYWDDFNRRIKETVVAVKNNTQPPVRRVSIFITNKCNFGCHYCNMGFGQREMSEDMFKKISDKYGKEAILHITGGEPSLVKWLYPFIDRTPNIRFHLNTNGYIKPPYNIKRLKVSLDTFDRNKFKEITQIDGFDKVMKNIKEATNYTLVSITYVLSKKTYREAPKFMRFCRSEFPKLYAVFFSCYKGNHPEFVMNNKEIDEFWSQTRFDLEQFMDKESLWLFRNTLDEKRRIIQGSRFPENKQGICYLSMSERIYDYSGNVSNCSHLYRDKVCRLTNNKESVCTYGCNRKLVRFNQDVLSQLKMNKGEQE